MLIMSADGKINADHDDEQNKQQDANNYKPILHYTHDHPVKYSSTSSKVFICFSQLLIQIRSMVIEIWKKANCYILDFWSFGLFPFGGLNLLKFGCIDIQKLYLYELKNYHHLIIIT